MTTAINLANIIFERDLDAVNLHRIVYYTDVSAKLHVSAENVELSYCEDKLVITIICKCADPFSVDCMDTNLPLLCKTVMVALDGTYPLPPSPSVRSRLQIKSNNVALGSCYRADIFNNKFCELCFSPIYLCSCVDDVLTKEEFMAKLHVFDLCIGCMQYDKNCTCGFKIYYLHKYYRSFAYNGKVPKRLNDIKRIAYLASCNVDVCLNCNRYSMKCVCDKEHRMYYCY